MDVYVRLANVCICNIYIWPFAKTGPCAEACTLAPCPKKNWTRFCTRSWNLVHVWGSGTCFWKVLCARTSYKVLEALFGSTSYKVPWVDGFARVGRRVGLSLLRVKLYRPAAASASPLSFSSCLPPSSRVCVDARASNHLKGGLTTLTYSRNGDSTMEGSWKMRRSNTLYEVLPKRTSTTLYEVLAQRTFQNQPSETHACTRFRNLVQNLVQHFF